MYQKQPVDDSRILPGMVSTDFGGRARTASPPRTYTLTHVFCQSVHQLHDRGITLGTKAACWELLQKLAPRQCMATVRECSDDSDVSAIQ